MMWYNTGVKSSQTNIGARSLSLISYLPLLYLLDFLTDA